MKLKTTLLCSLAMVFFACQKNLKEEVQSPELFSNQNKIKNGDAYQFKEVGSLKIGGLGAAEISAFDAKTNKLFVVNNSNPLNNKIDVIDFRNPALPVLIGSISMAPYGGLVNSVDAKNGLLAAGIESLNKQENGKVAVFNTSDYSLVKSVTVGALPDMVTYSPDGKYILSANEGEPNSSYTVDPLGTVSIISVKDNYSVSTLDFSSFASQESFLKSKGLRVYGPNASFAQDMEPEYITVSEDSRTAWVTLQENNAVAKINILTNTITDIFPLGFKNYNLPGNEIDPTDRPNNPFVISFNNWPVYGMYEPDGIAVWEENGAPYLFTANEGDAREYAAFAEEVRVSSLTLDANVFSNAGFLQMANNMGRLNVTSTLGNTDGGSDYEALYSLGARSFTVWNGLNGSLVWDSKNELEKKAVAANFYDDDRSDSKGVEPEGITIGVLNKGHVNKKTFAFIGMERADAVAIYDVSNPKAPVFSQILKTGDAPEGILFISEYDSPTKRSLLVVSSENDGVIKVYAPFAL